MARISTYGPDQTLHKKDKVLGSSYIRTVNSVDEFETKNFTLEELKGFFDGVLSVSTLNLKPNGGLVKETISGVEYLAVDLGASDITGVLANSDLANSSITINGSAISLGGSVTTPDTNTQLSTEQVQDIVGAMFSSNTETRVSATYQDSDGTIDLVVDDMTANTQLTTEQVQDIVGGMFTSNTETRISATYEDSDGTIDLVVNDMATVVNDSTANTYFPVVFHDESNGLLDDTGTFTYNPHYGNLRIPDNGRIHLGGDGNTTGGALYYNSAGAGATYLENYGSNHLVIRNLSDDGDITFKTDDGSGNTAEYLKIDGANTVITMANYDLQLKNIKIKNNTQFEQGSDGQVITSTGSGIQWEDIPAGLTLGTTSTTALAGNTSLLQIGTSSSTALRGDTTTITTSQANAITANTAKTGITTSQANAITANTAKTGITTSQANAITANTAKNTYPSADATKVGHLTVTQAVDLDTIESNVSTNNAKVGITTTQANNITANNAKVTFPGFGTTSSKALAGDTTTISTAQANAITANTAKETNVSTNLSKTTAANQITINSSDGDNIIIGEATSSIAGLMSTTHHDKLDNISSSANNYTLPTAASNTLGGVKVGSNLTIDGNGVLNVAAITLTTIQTANSESAQLALTAQEGDVVVRSDQNKSYVHNGGSAGTMADYTELLTTETYTQHDNISAASSVDNSGRTYIQDITVDSNGHVTGLVSATETVTDTNTQLSTADVRGKFSAGTNITISNGEISSTDTNTQLSDSQVRSKISGTGLISYNSSTGVISTSANNYTLPVASSSDLGGIKLGYTDNAKNYAVEIDGDNEAFVNVPWTDTNTDTNTQNTTTLSFVDSSDDIILRNTTGGAGSGNQDIKITAGSNITLNHTDANEFEIVATDTDTNTQRSDEDIRDVVVAMLTAGTNVSLSEDDAANTLTITSTDTNTDTNTQNTYSISIPSATTKFRLSGAGHDGSTTDDIEFVGSGATTVTRTNANKFTISSTDTNTDTNTNILSGGTITGDVTVNGDMTFEDGHKLELGTGADLDLYHTSNNSYIDNNTGNLYIRCNPSGEIHLRPKESENGVIIRNDGKTELYFDDAKKLETVTGGVNVTGTLTASADVVAYSDERLKTDIKTLDGSKVYDMRGVSFIKDNKQSSGVIAQELEKIAPELVNNEGEYKAVAYGNVVGYLIEAIKDLKAEIEELKKQIK